MDCCAIAHMRPPVMLQLAFVATTADSFRQIKLWVNYHQVLGVSLFYLFVDGQAARPEVCALIALLLVMDALPAGLCCCTRCCECKGQGDSRKHTSHDVLLRRWYPCSMCSQHQWDLAAAAMSPPQSHEHGPGSEAANA